MRSIGLFVGALALGAIVSAVARADCLSDCSDQYEAAMTACHQSNPDASQVDQLQMCMDQVQQRFEKCEEQCEEGD